MQEIFYEKIAFDYEKSYRVIYPLMKNTFFWHCHPEIELVYMEADSGIRHVGTHVSTYTGSDLVLIGNNLPHLNFDYRLRTNYTQIVVQLRTDFLGTAISHAPEFERIAELLVKADFGIAFDGRTKTRVAEKLKALRNLDGLEQLLEIIVILQLLARSDEAEQLNRDLSSKSFLLRDKLRMGDIYQFIDANYAARIDINVVADRANLTLPAFCRYFKRQTQMTFTNFVNQYRIERAKHLLIKQHNVNETCYLVGFESLSYFSKLFKTIVGVSPSDFRRERQEL